MLKPLLKHWMPLHICWKGGSNPQTTYPESPLKTTDMLL